MSSWILDVVIMDGCLRVAVEGLDQVLKINMSKHNQSQLLTNHTLKGVEVNIYIITITSTTQFTLIIVAFK